MKKFFSLIAAVLFAGSMMAEPIVINAGDVTGIESGTTGDLDCTLQGVYIAWNGAYYNPDNKGSIDIRVYAGKLLKLTAQETFSKVEIIGFAKASLAPSVNAGTITAGASYDQDTEKKEWEDPLLVIEDINANHLEITCNKQMRAYAIRITYGEGETPVLGAWSEIVFTEAIAADDLAENAIFKSDKEGFEAQISDSGNKMSIDANTCRFGTAEGYNKYDFRLKSGGASGSDKNFITISVPTDGQLGIAPRTGSNSATDRALVLIQGEDTLFSGIIEEAQAIEIEEGEETVKVYPFVVVPVKAGNVIVRYTAGLNFYAFGFNGTLAPEPEPEYFVIGSMTGWEVKPEFKLEANPEAEGEFMGEFTFAANDELKVVKNQKETWYPDGMDNNYKIEEAGDYTVYFRPEGNVEGWHYGYIYAEKKAELPDPTNCAEAREAALSVSANNELYNGGKEYTIEGYVTEIATTYSDQYHNITFWMADEKDGGKVLEAYRAVCEAEADAPAVGDKVAVTGKLTKYGNTPEFAAGCTYIITEKAEPEPEMNYYVVGNMTNWAPKAEYKLAANPEAEGEFIGEFTFAANDEFKVAYSDGATIADENWFPTGMENNFKIDEAGDYFVYFRPDGQGGEGWHEGYIYALKKEPVVVKQYEVAEAIAAGLADDTEILVRGIITKMEIKGKNFAKYGSINIYVADATGAEGEFEYYNCYSLEADTFRATVPEYDPNGNDWIQLEEASDANGNAIHVGDTVIALGKYKLYNEKHELNTGCYLVDIKHATPIEPEVITITELTYGEVQTGEFEQWGAVDVVLTNLPIVEGALYGDGYIFMMDIAPENANDITGVYSVDSLTLDPEYSGVVAYHGTDTTDLALVDGAVAFQIGQVSIENKVAQLAVMAELLVEDGTIFNVSGALVVYYEFIEEQGIEELMAETENGKAIKLMHEGQIYILKGNKLYNVNGQSVR